MTATYTGVGTGKGTAFQRFVAGSLASWDGIQATLPLTT